MEGEDIRDLTLVGYDQALANPAALGNPGLADVWEAVVKPVRDFVWGLVTALYGKVEAVTSALAALPRQVMDTFQSVLSWIWENVRTSAMWLWDQVKNLGYTIFDVLIKTPVDYWRTPIKSIEYSFELLGEQSWNVITSAFENYKEVKPEHAPAIAAGLFGAATGLGIGSHALAVGLEHTNPLSRTGWHYLSGFLSELSGWSRITAASLGVMVAIALRQPMVYYMQARFRPNLPEARDLQELYSRTTITAEIWRETMAYHGYSEAWLDRLDELHNTPLRYFALAGIARTGMFEPTFFQPELDRSGYSTEAKVYLMAMFKDQAGQRHKAQRMSSIKKLYLGEFLELADATALLIEAGIPEEFTVEWTAAWDLELRYQALTHVDPVEKEVWKRHKELRITPLKQLYRAGLITVDEVVVDLREARIPEEFIPDWIYAWDLEAKYYDLTHAPTPEKDVSISHRRQRIAPLKRLYRAGLASREEVAKHLEIAGVPREYVSDWIYAWNLERRYLDLTHVSPPERDVSLSYRRKLLTPLRKMFRDGFYDWDELIEGLIEAGTPEEFVPLEAKAIALETRWDELQEWVATYRWAYTHDTITEDEYRDLMSGILTSRSKLKVLFALDTLKRKKAPGMPAAVIPTITTPITISPTYTEEG